MPFHITCVCGRLTVAPDEAAGQTLRCANCDQLLEVPELAAPLPPPAPELAAEQAEPLVVAGPRLPSHRAARAPRHRFVNGIAATLVALALVGLAPVLIAARSATGGATNLVGGQLLEPWMLVTLLVSILQLVYLLYLLQLSDYSCVRVVSVLWLLLATAYALVLAIRLLGSERNWILNLLALDGNSLTTSQEALWCFLMTLLFGAASYLAGRYAVRWTHEL